MFLDEIKSLKDSMRLQTIDDVRRNDPVVLAYIGDSLYDLYVRCRLVFMGDYRAGSLHHMSVTYVCAHGQARSMDAIYDMLTQEEMEIVRRTKNAKITPPKNCDRATYHKATSFEALAGYLYLSEQYTRIEELFIVAFDSNKK